MIGDKGFGLVGLHMKGVSPGRGFLSRISKAPKMSKRHKIQNILKTQLIQCLSSVITTSVWLGIYVLSCC